MTDLIYARGKIFSVVHSDLQSSPKLVFHNYVDTEYKDGNKTLVMSKIEIFNLMQDSVFKFFNSYGSLNRNYNSDTQCSYARKDYYNSYTFERVWPKYPKFGCVRMPSKPEQLSVGCFMHNCTAGMTMTQSTNLSDFTKGPFFSTENELSWASKVLPSRTFKLSTIVDNLRERYEYCNSMDGLCTNSSYLNMRTFAVAKDLRVKSKYYVMNKNSTLQVYYFTLDNNLNLKYRIDIEALKDQLITAMTVQGKYLWALLPLRKSMVKICLKKYKVLESVDLSEMLSQVHQQFELFSNVPEIFMNYKSQISDWTTIYPMTAIAYVHKYRMFYITGYMWNCRFAIKLTSD